MPASADQTARQVLTITSAADLDRLWRAPMPRRIALRVPGKPPLDAQMREDRLARILDARPGGTVAPFVAVGLMAATLMFLTGLFDGYGVARTATVIALLLVMLALTGAGFGAVRRAVARRRAIRALSRWIDAG